MQLKLHFDVTLYKEVNSTITYLRYANVSKINSFCELNKSWLHSSLLVTVGSPCLMFYTETIHFVPCMRPGPFITLKRGSLDSIKQKWDNSTKIIQIINSSTYFIMLALVSKSPLYLCVRLLTNFIVSKWATKLVSSGGPAYYIFTHF